MDVESILSARGIYRKRPSICWQGKTSNHIVCRLIIGVLACRSSVWCNWLKMNGLPEIWLLQAQLLELSDRNKCTQPHFFHGFLDYPVQCKHTITAKIKVQIFFYVADSINITITSHFNSNNKNNHFWLYNNFCEIIMRQKVKAYRSWNSLWTSLFQQYDHSYLQIWGGRNGYFVEIGMDVQEHSDGWYIIQEKQK